MVNLERLKVMEDHQCYDKLFIESPSGYAVHKKVSENKEGFIDYEFIDTNTSFEHIIGLKRADLIGQSMKTMLPKIENVSFDWIGLYYEITMFGKCIDLEVFAEPLDKWFQVKAYALNDRDFVTQFTDITKYKNKIKQYEKEVHLYENAIKGANVGIWEWNVKTGEQVIDERWASMIGYTVAELSPISIETWRKLSHPEDLEEAESKLKLLFMKETKRYCLVFRMKHKDGRWLWIESRGIVNSWTPKGQPLLVSGSHIDITEEKQRQEELIYLGYHDQLTGLYNRRFFNEELIRLDSSGNLPLTIVQCDVNGLKLINDSFGHELGDKLLKRVANNLSDGCSPDGIISRFGGDEFALILPKTNRKEAEKIIKRIKGIISNERVGGLEISVCFGFATKNHAEEEIKTVFKNAEDHMYRYKLYESKSARSKTIDLIINTLYEKNNREMLHSKRVSTLCESFAKWIGIGKEEVNIVKVAGLMHDIGKIGVDEKILNKSETLTDAEWEEIKKHSEIGYRILSSVSEFSEIAEYVLEHQEKWDGTGYPKGLSGDEISLEARIISISDAYDAMTGDRAYGKVLSKKEALEEIQMCAGSQFDPQLAKLFIEMLQ